MNGHVIATGLGIAIGSSLLFSAAWTLFHAWRSRTWPSVWGVVDAAKADDPGTRTPVADITYRYRVGERELTGRRVFFGDAFWRGSKSAPSAYVAADAYMPGQEIRVFFDPDLPARSVLQRGIDERLYFLVVLGVLFLLAGVGAFSGFWRVE